MTAAFEHIQFVFLDRDGVVNRKLPEGEYLKDPDAVAVLPGVESAIASLNRSGRYVIVVSNQRGIALGRVSPAEVAAIQARIEHQLAASHARIDAFYYCPHDEGECDCRKPGIGLFLQAFRDFPQASKENSLIVGDSLSDIEAARNFGIRSIFILGDPATQKEGAEQAASLADHVAASLFEAVEQWVL